MRRGLDFAQAPMLLIWEVTRACALACRHCRASAEDRRDPRELSFEQGCRLIDDVARMGTPLIIFTGGDPLQRDDLEDLCRHAVARGLRVGTIPAATPRLTRERILSLKAAGVHQLAISLDGPDAARHDAFRRIEGTFDQAMRGVQWIREAGVPLQINTVFGAWNANEFDEMAERVASLEPVFWEVFFLVPTGRGSELTGCAAEQMEALFARLYDFANRVKFIVKVTEGQHFRRYVSQRGGPAAMGRLMMSGRPVNAGHGFCFVDHTGEVCPSGFLPIPCGNVKTTSVVDVYREHPVFRELRDFSKLEGKCAVCEYRDLCGGGSRARSYAVTGRWMASEPFCAHEPAPANLPAG